MKCIRVGKQVRHVLSPQGSKHDEFLENSTLTPHSCCCSLKATTSRVCTIYFALYENAKLNDNNPCHFLISVETELPLGSFSAEKIVFALQQYLLTKLGAFFARP